MEQNRKVMRNIGLVLVLLTPITAFISFAIFAILFGEENIEGDNANAVLTALAFTLPLLIGLAVTAWAQFGGPVPRVNQVAAAAAIFGGLCIAIGIWSVISSGDDGDASIGGAILVFFGVLTLATGAVLLFTARRTPAMPPPPSTPPLS